LNIWRTLRSAALTAATAVIVALAGAVAVHMAWAPHMGTKTQALKKGETRAVEVVVAQHYYQEFAFWIPLAALAFVGLILVVMHQVVSHQRSRTTPGALIGTLMVVLALLFGQQLLPDDFGSQSFWHGVSFMILFVIVFVTLRAYLRIDRKLNQV
jgi:hypothetical protein